MKKVFKLLFIYFIVAIILLTLFYFGIGIYTLYDGDYFDYDNLLLKGRATTGLGYTSHCFIALFGCSSKESIVFKFSSKIITHDSNCSLKYIYSDETVTKDQYELSCYYIAAFRRNTMFADTYKEILDDINREKILNKGYKLPDKSNPIIKLAPNKQLN